jgi:hypothetical protein
LKFKDEDLERQTHSNHAFKSGSGQILPIKSEPIDEKDIEIKDSLRDFTLQGK